MSRVAGRSFLKKMYRVLAQSHCLALHMISNVSMSSGAANPRKSESPDSELVVAQFTVSGGGTTAICKHCLVRVERSSHAMLVKHLAACELLPEVMRHVLDEEAQEQAARHIGVYARHAELFSRFHVLGLLRAKCKTCETTVYGHLGSLHVHVALCKRSGKAVAARFARSVLPSCPSTAPRVNTPAQTPRPQQPRRCLRGRSVASTAAAVPTSPAASPRAARCDASSCCHKSARQKARRALADAASCFVKSTRGFVCARCGMVCKPFMYFRLRLQHLLVACSATSVEQRAQLSAAVKDAHRQRAGIFSKPAWQEVDIISLTRARCRACRKEFCARSNSEVRNHLRECPGKPRATEGAQGRPSAGPLRASRFIAAPSDAAETASEPCGVINLADRDDAGTTEIQAQHASGDGGADAIDLSTRSVQPPLSLGTLQRAERQHSVCSTGEHDTDSASTLSLGSVDASLASARHPVWTDGTPAETAHQSSPSRKRPRSPGTNSSSPTLPTTPRACSRSMDGATPPAASAQPATRKRSRRKLPPNAVALLKSLAENEGFLHRAIVRADEIQRIAQRAGLRVDQVCMLLRSSCQAAA